MDNILYATHIPKLEQIVLKKTYQFALSCTVHFTNIQSGPKKGFYYNFLSVMEVVNKLRV